MDEIEEGSARVRGHTKRVKNAGPATELFPLRSPSTKRPFLVFDIESKDGESQRPGFTRPFLAAYYDGYATKQFRNLRQVKKLPWRTRALEPGGCIDRIMRSILRPRYRGHNIYAHNGGNFDFLHVIAWLAKQEGRYQWRVTPQQSSILRIQVKDPKKRAHGKALTWNFVDSVRILPITLAVASKAFGKERKGEIDLKLHENDPDWESYNARDCTALYDVLESVTTLLENLGGEMKATAPSASLALFRRVYQLEPIQRNRCFNTCTTKSTCEGCFHAWIRRGYCGGRTEVISTKGKHVRYYDVTSSYPASMLNYMPTSLAWVKTKNLSVEWLANPKLREKSVVFVECDVEVPASCHLPPLPWHEPKTGKLLFPAGKFSGVWDLAELDLLPFVGGKILKVKKVAWFQRAQPIFRVMVQQLYRFRDKTREDYDPGLAELAKLLLNALYGKFGQRPEHEELHYSGTGSIPEGSTPIGGDVFHALLWSRIEAKDSAHIIPAIAAHVTALARRRLYVGMLEVGKRGGNIQYMDTDSLLVDIELPAKAGLGKFKNEYPEMTFEGEFLRPKVYQITPEKRDARGRFVKRIMRWKGLPRTMLTFKVFRSASRGIAVRFRRIQKLKTMARNNLESPIMVRVHRSLKSAYDKRILHEDGTTSPVVVDAIEA